MFAEDLVEGSAQTQNFLSLDGNVRRLPLGAAQRLVHVNGGIGERVAHALGTGGKQDGAKAGGESHGYRRDRALYLLHRIVDGHSGVDLPAGRVDVHPDRLGGVFPSQVK